MKYLLLILLSGCSYNAYNDPNYLWPESWVDRTPQEINWCAVHAQLDRAEYVQVILIQRLQDAT